MMPGGAGESLSLAVAGVKNAVRLARFCAVGNLRGIDAEETDAELRAVRGDGHETVAVGDALHHCDEGAGVLAWAGARKQHRRPLSNRGRRF